MLRTSSTTYFFDHWNVSFILIFDVHQIAGFHYAMEVKTSDFILFKKRAGVYYQKNSTRSREF